MDHSQHTLHEGHASMNHDHMHMDQMQHGVGGHIPMRMSFAFTTSSIVLFSDWTFTTIGGLIGSMIGIFIMAALYEGLKYFREYLFWKTYNSLQYRAVAIPEKNPSHEEPQIVHPSMLSKMHFLQTFLHMVQMVISYFLMLIFMTYNAWLCIAVVCGAGVGYFLFGWKKSVVVDVTEHCH